MRRGEAEQLEDIADAIAAIRAHVADRTTNERLRRDAVLYNLMVLGEAVKGITDASRAKHPEIPWRRIVGLRDLLTHEYFRVDMTLVRGIVERDLGPLEAAVSSLRGKKRS